MSSNLSGTSLGGYGVSTYERDHCTCVYCGFDGRSFDTWMQLSIDHVRPRSSGGTDDPENLVVACGACNCITSRMQFPSEMSVDEIIEAKRRRVAERRKAFYDHWLQRVAPRYLDRPLPDVGSRAVPGDTPPVNQAEACNDVVPNGLAVSRNVGEQGMGTS